ncbi:MAG: hypothetical protein D3909_03670 [Candidatus Electrothrix sp. ATG1]|nr:hypothetical protein [Candidatus Electrothrix sp. ATG1]
MFDYNPIKLSTVESKVTTENKTKKREKAEEEIKSSLNFFEKLKEKGTNSSEAEGEFNTDELWKDCTQRLQRAERLLDEHPEINSQKRQKTVRTFLAYSRLYQYLEVARNSYKEQKFNKAVDEYHHALDLLEEERILFGAKYYQESASKIKRTVVILEVSLELGKAVEAENKNNLRGSLNHYKKVLHIIRSSKASKDHNIKKLERYVRTKINEQSLEAAKSSNQEWWKKNYEKIFKKEFPSARTSLLSKPRIHFIKVKNGLLLYIIRCSEKGITLELTYQYDLATGTWSPYRGKL